MLALSGLPLPQLPGRRVPRHCHCWPALLVLISVFHSRCSNPLPSPEQAAQAILASAPFSSDSALAVRLPRLIEGGCEEALVAQPEWNRWSRLGLASAAPILTSSGPFCRFVLEETIAREAQGWMHRVTGGSSAGADELIVPVAIRTILRVREIRPAGRGAAEAAFDWQWRLNAAGQKLGIDSGPRQSVAQLVLEEGRWRAVRIDLGAE